MPAEDKVSSSSLLLDIMDVQSYFFRSNLHIGKSKESSEEKEEVGESGGTVEEQNGRAKYENCKSVVNDDEQFRTNRLSARHHNDMIHSPNIFSGLDGCQK